MKIVVEKWKNFTMKRKELRINFQQRKQIMSKEFIEIMK